MRLDLAVHFVELVGALEEGARLLKHVLLHVESGPLVGVLGTFTLPQIVETNAPHQIERAQNQEVDRVVKLLDIFIFNCIKKKKN